MSRSLTCFLDWANEIVQKGIWEIPGFKWNLNRGSGELDMIRFLEEGSEVIAISMAQFFGGEIREILFPSEGGRVKYQGLYKKESSASG